MAFAVNRLGLRNVMLATSARVAVLMLAITALPTQADPLTAVADLRYGVALYEYYQNRNLEALTELMVAQKQGGIQGHGDNPEIMEGGFSMAYGMERKASDIFSRLLDGNRPQRTRDAAWFYLAQMRYLRGDWAGASEAIKNIDEHAQGDVAADVTALRFNLAIQQNDLPLAEAIYSNNRDIGGGWRPYMQFNLGAAYSRNGVYTQGNAYFTQLLQMPERSPEHLALYDKAMTAAGYGYLIKEDYAQAIEYFSQVRLTSPLSSRALLGYGWAAAEQGDYRLALSPWQALAKRPMIDQYSQEALVAIPYAYEKLGFTSQALQQLRVAEQSYLTEIDRLQKVMDDVQGYAIREALNIERSEDFNWLQYAESNQLAPQISYLIALFSRQEFIGLVQEVRDLLTIQNQFAEWQNKLDFYSQMLNEREANRAREVDFIAQHDIDEKITAMERQRDTFAQQAQALTAKADFLTLVNPEDSTRLERILRAEKNVQILQAAARDRGVHVMPAEELAELAENLRRQKGRMLWDSAQLYDERLWRAQRELKLVNNELTAIRARQQRVANIVGQGFDLQPYRQRIARANEQLISQSVDIDYAIEQAQNVLREQVISALQQQHGRMNHYLAQARLSIARLLDASQVIDAPTPAAEASENE